jgi:hypothetical protein
MPSRVSPAPADGAELGVNRLLDKDNVERRIGHQHPSPSPWARCSRCVSVERNARRGGAS